MNGLITARHGSGVGGGGVGLPPLLTIYDVYSTDILCIILEHKKPLLGIRETPLNNRQRERVTRNPEISYATTSKGINEAEEDISSR